MKKILLITLSIFMIGISSQAQIKKGASIIGGSVGFSAGKVSLYGKKYKDWSTLISPSYGFAVKENLILGFEGFFGSGEDENMEYTLRNKGYGVGVFTRKYQPLGKGFYLFGQAGLRGGFNRYLYAYTSNYAANRILKNYSLTASVYPGISYAINRKLHIEAALPDLLYIQYNKESTLYEIGNYTNKSQQFSLGSSLSGLSTLSVGLRFVFN